MGAEGCVGGRDSAAKLGGDKSRGPHAVRGGQGKGKEVRQGWGGERGGSAGLLGGRWAYHVGVRAPPLGSVVERGFGAQRLLQAAQKERRDTRQQRRTRNCNGRRRSRADAAGEVASAGWQCAGGRRGCRSGGQGSRGNSPLSATLQAPGLPYTCGPDLGRAAATLL